MTSRVISSSIRDNLIAIYAARIHLAKPQRVRCILTASYSHSYNHVPLARDDALCLEWCVSVPVHIVQTALFRHFKAITEETPISCVGMQSKISNHTYHIAVGVPEA